MTIKYNIPDFMNAVVTIGNGGYDKLIYKKVKTPIPNRSEVVVKVLAAGMNNTEINTRIGWYSSNVKTGTDKLNRSIEEGGTYNNAGWNGSTNFPLIQGTDCCGIIVKCGDKKDSSLIGKRVIVRSCMRVDGFKSRQKMWIASNFDGAFAEYVKVPTLECFPINCNWSDAELATIPCSYGTAENMLHIVNCNKDNTILVTGASGGVGSAVIQLAKIRGSKVIAVVNRSKFDNTFKIGADKVVDRDEDFLNYFGENSVDLVVDVVGGINFSYFLKLLSPGGKYVSAGAISNPMVNFDLRDLYLKDLSMYGCTTWEEPIFNSITRYIEDGKLKPLLSRTYNLSNIVEAQKEFLKKKHFGNFVLIP